VATSHPTPVSSSSRLSGFRLPVIALATAAIAVVAVPSGVGHAAPASHLTLAQAKAQVAALDSKSEQISQAFDGASSQLTALQHKEQVTNAELARDQAALGKVQQKLAASAAAAYRTGGMTSSMSLVASGSAQTFIDQTSSLQEVANYQSNQLAFATAAQRAVTSAEVVHNAQVAQQKKTLASISAQRSQINNLLADRKAVLAKLTAAQRHTYVAQQVQATQHAVAQRATYNGPATGQASAAVQFAYAQLGKPYLYGGTGPGAYDCSGLTMESWAAAGVGLPRTAAAQQASIPSVSIADLEPGDLVFFGVPAYHTAIYIGGGNIIQAPHTGASVEITPLSYMPPTSAGRP
jgi:peptidoglycan DL-endopeptidase CwlO